MFEIGGGGKWRFGHLDIHIRYVIDVEDNLSKLYCIEYISFPFFLSLSLSLSLCLPRSLAIRRD